MKYLLMILTFFIITLTSCLSVNYTKDYITYTKDLTSDQCYIYGKFFMINANDSNNDFMSLGLKNNNTLQIYKIYFMNRDYIFAAKIPPGDYSLKYIYYGESTRTIDIDPRKDTTMYDFTINKGEAFYIGDFYANCLKKTNEYEEKGYKYSAWITHYWLEDYFDNYEATTKNLKILYKYNNKIKFKKIFTK
ncbi:MAG: hypothetical protein A2086_02640 [Spirochaetes bacterium GWD1_27_9]|nr:MAG: hypothetical protein A2Z98_05315 [Spirochaetes bacterium GWB1_27_13]OHD27278.1 MAG: hypothetical protein A2Y34_10015 [Spirochaetes bacterium GWC1_27_15]OHD33505.1 MAG: hypothetical protein A2086_02640 [Spirochaetes bacterium GWD1_27_9]